MTRKNLGRVVFVIAAVVAIAALIVATSGVAQASTQVQAGYGGGVYQRWSSIWTFVGTEWVYLGSVGCWSADGNPFGYVNHWHYHGGWIYVDEYGNVLPWGYGWWQGYSYPDGPRQTLGPRDVTYTTDFYKCWSH